MCDDGINNGSYGGCMPGCGALGPHCGDGIVQSSEQCDHGLANGVGNDTCGSYCQLR